MPLQVTLASGREVPVTTAPGATVEALRGEVAEHLDLHPKSVALTYDSNTLEDTDAVPDGVVNVIAVRLPWVGAPEEKVNDLGGGEFEVVGEAEAGDSKANALCLVGFTEGIEYFEVEVVEGDGAFIGITTKDGLAAGYKVKGLLFGGPGNLTNGSGGLRTRFGEGVKKGSIIGVTVDLTDAATVGVTFWEGDKCLGEAFKGCPRSPGAAVYPLVSAKKVGDKFKLSLRRMPRVQDTSKPPHPAHGSWDLTRVRVGGGDDFDLGPAKAVKGGKGAGKGATGSIVMRMAQSPSDAQEFRMNHQIGNTMNNRITLTVGEDGTETLQVALGPSTMMMAPPDLMALEQLLGPAFPRITSWTVAGAGTDAATLQLRGTDIELDYVYYNQPPEEPISSVTLP